MILRIDKIAVDLPRPKNPSPNSAAAMQELLGGRFPGPHEAEINEVIT
jgi:Mn-containing catalase